MNMKWLSGLLCGFAIAMSTLPLAMGIVGLLILVTFVQQASAKPWHFSIRDQPFMVWACLYLTWSLLTLSYTTAPWEVISAHLYKPLLLLTWPIFYLAFQRCANQERIHQVFIVTLVVITLIADLRFFFSDAPQHANHLFKNRIVTSFYTSFAAFLSFQAFLDRLQHRFYYLLGFIALVLHLVFVNCALTGLVTFLGLMLLVFYQRFQRLNTKKTLVSLVLILGLLVMGYAVLSLTLTQSPRSGGPPVLLPISAIQRHWTEWHSESNLQTPRTSLAVRFLIMKQTWQMIETQPILGFGLFSHFNAYQPYHLAALGDGTVWGNPHNAYLLIWLESGAVGLGLMLMLLGSQWRATFQLDPPTRRCAQGLILAMVLGCFGDSFFFLTATWMIYLYFSALYFSKE